MKTNKLSKATFSAFKCMCNQESSMFEHVGHGLGSLVQTAVQYYWKNYCSAYDLSGQLRMLEGSSIMYTYWPWFWMGWWGVREAQKIWIHFPSQLGSYNPSKSNRIRCQDAFRCWLHFLIGLGSIVKPYLHPQNHKNQPPHQREHDFSKNRFSKLCTLGTPIWVPTSLIFPSRIHQNRRKYQLSFLQKLIDTIS